jgi:hypothetical protein
VSADAEIRDAERNARLATEYAELLRCQAAGRAQAHEREAEVRQGAVERFEAKQRAHRLARYVERKAAERRTRTPTTTDRQEVDP